MRRFTEPLCHANWLRAGTCSSAQPTWLPGLGEEFASAAGSGIDRRPKAHGRGAGFRQDTGGIDSGGEGKPIQAEWRQHGVVLLTPVCTWSSSGDALAGGH